jgi:hypothetical protein
VDGEVARFKKMSNPIGGKLLDGACHRATEFALLGTFGIAAYAKSGSLLAVFVALLLMSGDAMYVFAYERRLTTLRQGGFKGRIRTTAEGTYARGLPWSGLTRKQQVATITGLFHYKSVYAVIALSYLPTAIFVSGLGALALFKHWKWLRLVHRTLSDVATLQPATEAPRAGNESARNQDVAAAPSAPGGVVRS